MPILFKLQVRILRLKEINLISLMTIEGMNGLQTCLYLLKVLGLWYLQVILC